MEGNVIIQGLPFDQFGKSIADMIRHVVAEEVRKAKVEELQEKLLSPEETCKLFVPAISIPTLNNYAKEGLIKKHYLGRLTFYKYSEIIEALKTYKKYSRTQIVDR